MMHTDAGVPSLLCVGPAAGTRAMGCARVLSLVNVPGALHLKLVAEAGAAAWLDRKPQ